MDDKSHPIRIRQTIDFACFEKMKNTRTTIDLTDDELKFLWALHEDMQRMSNSLGIGPRIVRQIDRYLKNIPASQVLTRSDGFDLQIVQRILTKIKGTEEKLGDYFRGKEKETSRFVQLLDRFQHLSHFKETRKKAEQKMKELKENGYTV